jgi:hypothetical protein
MKTIFIIIISSSLSIPAHSQEVSKYLESISYDSSITKADLIGGWRASRAEAIFDSWPEGVEKPADLLEKAESSIIDNFYFNFYEGDSCKYATDWTSGYGEWDYDTEYYKLIISDIKNNNIFEMIVEECKDLSMIILIEKEVKGMEWEKYLLKIELARL